MNIIERINTEVPIYDLFDLADPRVKYLTKEKPCQISCPFHGVGDRTPSARVYPDTNSFRCFYCSKSWSPIQFWAEVNQWFKEDGSLDISRAIDDLSLRFDISVQTFDWQRKFYAIKKESEQRDTPTQDDKVSLLTYYTWEVCKAMRGVSSERREVIREDVLTMWQELDSMNLNSDSWDADLKNWYKRAKLVIGGD